MALQILSALDGSQFADSVGSGGSDAGIDCGAAIKGAAAVARDLFLQHTWVNKIYDVRMYLTS